MMNFFEFTRTRSMQSPPRVLPRQKPRPLLTTEAYRDWVYTPGVEEQMLPGVDIPETAMKFTGARNGQIVLQPSNINGQTVMETVLVLGAVSQ